METDATANIRVKTATGGLAHAALLLADRGFALQLLGHLAKPRPEMRPPAQAVADILDGCARDISGRGRSELEPSSEGGGRRRAVEPGVRKLFAGKPPGASHHHARAVGGAAKSRRPACDGGGAREKGRTALRPLH